MAKYRVTSPDGQQFDVTAPDEAKQDEVMSFAQKHFDQLASDRKEMERLADPTVGMEALDKARAGAGKFFADVGTGARQMFDVATGGSKAKALSDEVKDTRKRDARLMQSGWAKAGYFTPALATAFAPGANTMAGAAAYGGTMGALQPTTEDESRVANTLVGTVLGTAGQAIGQEAGAALRTKLAERAAARAAAEAANAPRDAVIRQAREAGLVMPPSQSNPSVLNRTLEGAAGKLTTAQEASAKNAPRVNEIIARDLRLPEGQPITREALATVRKEAGQAYENLAQGTFSADKIYADRLGALAQQHRTLAAEVPELANKEVLALANSLAKNEFSGRTLLNVIGSLREKADTAFRAGEKSAFKFYRGMADEAENLIERNLLARDAAKLNIAKASGSAYQAPKDALEAFREARQLIAKSYGAEGALEGTTINAAKYADYMRKGKPLSGGSKLVAQFATEFPKAAQLPSKMGSRPFFSPLDVATAVLSAAAGTAGTGGASGMLGAGMLVARPALRSALLADAVQKMASAPKYTAPVLDRVAAQAGPRLPAVMRAALPSAKVTADAAAH